MYRLLAVSWALPPILKPRSLQVARLLSALHPLGWEIDVITVDPETSITARPLDEKMVNHYSGGFNVYRTKESFLQPIAIALGKLFQSAKPFPDAEIGWRRTAESLGKKLVDNSYDALVSFAQPWSSHFVAQAIRREAALPWVAHFSDPWADNPYYSKLGQLQRLKILNAEESIVNQAQKLVFTNDRTLNQLAKRYGDSLLKKAIVLPHAYDESLLPDQRVFEQESKRMNLVYTGNLYGKRSPEWVIRGLALAQSRDRIRIQIAGNVQDVDGHKRLADQLGVSQSIIFTGQVDYQESLNLLNQADALLLLDAPDLEQSLFLPSKLIDYLMFNKIILGVTPLQGASADVLRKLGCPVVAPEDSTAIATELNDIVSRWQRGNLALATSSLKMRATYESSYVARKFNGLLLDTLKIGKI